MSHSLLVKSPGMLTSIQDAGRKGFLHTGLPAAGCMDVFSMRLANWLVGNTADTAVMEVTLLGPVLTVNEPLSMGIAGAQFEVFVNNTLADTSVTLHLDAGDELRFGALKAGCRAYIAIAGGFDLLPVLNSLSTYMPANIGGMQGRPLQAGDILPVASRGKSAVSERPTIHRQLPQELSIRYSRRTAIRVVEGAEGDWFTQGAWQQFLSQEFSVSPQSNRMGYRLSANSPCVLEKQHHQEMLTTGLVPGSIQVNHQGEPIIIMVDGQTSGGYPRIANSISADQHLLGQVRPGDKLRFYKVTQSQATALYREKQQWLSQLLSVD